MESSNRKSLGNESNYAGGWDGNISQSLIPRLKKVGDAKSQSMLPSNKYPLSPSKIASGDTSRLRLWLSVSPYDGSLLAPRNRNPLWFLYLTRCTAFRKRSKSPKSYILVFDVLDLKVSSGFSYPNIYTEGSPSFREAICLFQDVFDVWNESNHLEQHIQPTQRATKVSLEGFKIRF